MKILVAGNKDYGLAKSISSLYPTASFLSRTSGYNLNDYDTRVTVSEMSLNYDVFLSVSCLSQFRQTLLLEEIVKKWCEKDHNGYLIAIGSSADTPVKGTIWSYPSEKKALRAYMRQLGQIVASDYPKRWRSTYLSPGNMHTPKQDEKMPGVLKLDTDYVAKVISWLIDQPATINISELCLDRIQIE